MTPNSSMPAPAASSSTTCSADLGSPAGSISVCRGRVRWRGLAAVTRTFRIFMDALIADSEGEGVVRLRQLETQGGAAEEEVPTDHLARLRRNRRRQRHSLQRRGDAETRRHGENLWKNARRKNHFQE